ncbi:MAG: shikimate kinase [Thainema sp.]
MTTDLLQGVNLFLIGMMGSGKTTVGQLLAEQLSYRFFDTDAVIEQAAHRPIRDIFATEGEVAFRQLETQVLSQLSAYTHLVIATGGGIVLERMNWSYLRHGIVVWLDVAVDLLYERLQDDATRPLLQTPDPQKTLQTILGQREHLYSQADLTITIQPHESPSETCDRILTELPHVLRPEVTEGKTNSNL